MVTSPVWCSNVCIYEFGFSVPWISLLQWSPLTIWIDNPVLCSFLRTSHYYLHTLKKYWFKVFYPFKVPSYIHTHFLQNDISYHFSVTITSSPHLTSLFHFSHSLDHSVQCFNFFFAYTLKFFGHLFLPFTLQENKAVYFSESTTFHLFTSEYG